MVGEERRRRSLILTIVGIIIAIYVLFPFYLVVMNSFKVQADIVASPIALKGVSFKQFITNLGAVINNSNFNFWRALFSSVVITVISLALLALFGSMAAWVISRNNKKKMGYSNLYDLYRFDDHSFPGRYASAGLDIP